MNYRIDINGTETRNTKAQANIMEYVLMTFFIFVVVIALMFFLSMWQASESQLDTTKERLDNIGDIADFVLKSPYFIKGSSMVVDPMFDDSKLTAFKTAFGVDPGEEGCQRLENMFGPNWYFEVIVFEYNSDGSESEEVECDSVRYPDCNKWTICKDNSRESMKYVLPVNIYRKMEQRTDIGLLRIGAYAD
jgi:hypothetical protein